MPIPRTADAGRIIRFLKKDKPDMYNQMVAMALDTVRKAGGNVKGEDSRILKALKKKLI